MHVSDFGPKMRALSTDRQQRFVLELLRLGERKYTAAYTAAGYKGNANSIHANAWKLAHREDIQAALHEEAGKRMHGLVPLALKTAGDIMEDPEALAADKGRMAVAILDRAGLHSTVEHQHVIGLADDTEALARIRMLAERNGIPLEALLGGRLVKQVALLPQSREENDISVALEAEFVEG
jgi:hypothetical protein